MEVRIPVATVQVDYKCPKCERGFLRPTGNALMTFPPQYPHFCGNPDCDYMETFMLTYPYMDYNRIEIDTQ
jgi:hypothetical protein